MRKIIFIFSLASLFLFLKCTSNEKALNKKLEEMAANLNEAVPVMLDQYTRFDEALVSDDNVFQYRYTVLNVENPDSLVDRGLQSLRENIQSEFSTNPELRVFKENNVVIEYVYMDEQGRTIRLLRVNPQDYQ